MSQTPHRIIAIEDNHADVTLLRHALDQHGEPYILEILPDGLTALEYARTNCGPGNPEPCLIILDLHLPRHSGAEILQALRANPEFAKVSVAVLTTGASPREREEVLRLGVRLYREKPMDWDQTVELARELIDACKNPRTLAAHP